MCKFFRDEHSLIYLDYSILGCNICIFSHSSTTATLGAGKGKSTAGRKEIKAEKGANVGEERA